MAKRTRGIGLAVAMALTAFGLTAQEKKLTNGERTHLDAGFSPDGRWVSYEGGGILYVRPSAGGTETPVIDVGGGLTYFWEAQSSSFLVFGAERLTQVSRDGQTRRTIALLTGQGFVDFFFQAPDGLSLYGVRRVGFATYVSRVRLTDGKVDDLITLIPGVTSLDIDTSGKKLLISATSGVFQYEFYQADLDGKNVVVLTTPSLGAPSNHGRWVDAAQNFVFECTGIVNSQSGGFQVWGMNAQAVTAVPLTWKPRQRRGVPSLSSDGQWLATLEYQSATGLGRVLVLPTSGGGERVLAGPYYHMGDRVRFAADGKSVVYVGAEKFTDRPDVRVLPIGDDLRLAPTVRPGRTSQVELKLASTEVGAVFLGFGLLPVPFNVPPLKGGFSLDLTKEIVLLYAAAGQDLKASFVVPNDVNLVAQTVFLQSLRLVAGPSLQGEILLPIWVDIAP